MKHAWVDRMRTPKNNRIVVAVFPKSAITLTERDGAYYVLHLLRISFSFSPGFLVTVSADERLETG